MARISSGEVTVGREGGGEGVVVRVITPIEPPSNTCPRKLLYEQQRYWDSLGNENRDKPINNNYNYFHCSAILCIYRQRHSPYNQRRALSTVELMLRYVRTRDGRCPSHPFSNFFSRTNSTVFFFFFFGAY